MIYRVDIDETICITPLDRDYSQAVPIPERIAKINGLYDAGHQIIYWTSRGWGTGQDWGKITYRQLVDWGCKFHDLQFGKPYYDLLIDDRTMRPEEFEKL